MNAEDKVIDAIDELVSDSLAQPITDDYSVNRYEKCELCRSDWHGLPTMDEYDDRSCPGAWASDEAKAAWREMFPAPAVLPDLLGEPTDWQFISGGRLHPVRSVLNLLRETNLREFTPPWVHFVDEPTDAWVFTDQARIWVLDGHIDFERDDFRILLFGNVAELPTRGGYTRGGLPVSMATTVIGNATSLPRVEVTFAIDVVWTIHQSIHPRYAMLVWRDNIIASTKLNTGPIFAGNTLIIEHHPLVRLS